MDNTENIALAYSWGQQTILHETPDGGKAIVIPGDARVHAIPPLDPQLLRIRQSVVVHDAPSLVAYVNKHKTPDTAMFAEPGFLAEGRRAIIHVALDYHGETQPHHVAHSVRYEPRYSDQWTRWHNACREPMAQVDFAEFVEECRADIQEPSAAALLDVVRTFKASKKVEYDSVVYQPNGDVKLAYDERTEQKGSSGVLPEMIKLGIPVYFRGDLYAMPVFVRYRVGGGTVKFQMKLDRPEIIEDEAFKGLVATVSEETSVAAYLGRIKA